MSNVTTALPTSVAVVNSTSILNTTSLTTTTTTTTVYDVAATTSISALSSSSTTTTTTAGSYEFVNVFDFAEFETVDQWVNAIILPFIYVALILFSMFSRDLVCRICNRIEFGKSKSAAKAMEIKSARGSPLVSPNARAGEMSSSEAVRAMWLSRSLGSTAPPPTTQKSPPLSRTSTSKQSSRESKHQNEDDMDLENSATDSKHTNDTETEDSKTDPGSSNALNLPSLNLAQINAQNRALELEKHIEQFFLKGFRMEFLEYYRTFEDFVAVIDRDPPLPSHALRVSYHNKGRAVRIRSAPFWVFLLNISASSNGIGAIL